MEGSIKILETFRDAIQGLDHRIPSDTKVEIIRSLMEVGFDYLDVGSFVSSRIIPQFSDMDYVLDHIGESPGVTNLFALVANLEGAKQACSKQIIDMVGFPFSTSETFLYKNINAGFTRTWVTIENIAEECEREHKTLMVYLAMAFGNPYGDPVNIETCLEFTSRLYKMGIKHVHLSDIIGVAKPPMVAKYYRELTAAFPDIEFGIHLHIRDGMWQQNITEAWRNGCRIFDGVISGLGGCPLSGYEMLQNLPSADLLEFARKNKIQVNVNPAVFQKARSLAVTQLSPYF